MVKTKSSSSRAPKIEVTVIAFREDEQIIQVNEGSTVKQALAMAGIENADDDMDIRSNGIDVDLTDEVKENDVLYVVPKVKGGC